MRSNVALRALLLLIPALAACGPLPRPFQPEVKPRNELLTLDDSAGIVVLPLDGLVEVAPAEASQALAEALRERNVPATTRGGNRASRYLFARGELRSLDARREELWITWELSDSQGQRIAEALQRERLPREAWARMEPQTLMPVLEEAADVIASLVQEPAVHEAVAPEPQAVELRVAVVPLDPAPGDAATSLPAALSIELLGAGVALSRTPEPGDLVVGGKVELDPPEGGSQRVEILWIVSRDGEELGRVSQANRVPAGSLDGPWGPVAPLVAGAALDGLLPIFDRIAKAGAGAGGVGS